jgi:hypothetical protein
MVGSGSLTEDRAPEMPLFDQSEFLKPAKKKHRFFAFLKRIGKPTSDQQVMHCPLFCLRWHAVCVNNQLDPIGQ